jgi:hypothetical protein
LNVRGASRILALPMEQDRLSNNDDHTGRTQHE